MLKGFTTILIKELRELMRDPKILVGMIVLPLIMFPVMGLVFGYAVQSAQEEAQHATLLVVNNDNGNWSQIFVRYVNTSMSVVVVDGTSPQDVVDQGLLAQYNSTTLLMIPSGFSENLTRHAAGELNVTGLLMFMVYLAVAVESSAALADQLSLLSLEVLIVRLLLMWLRFRSLALLKGKLSKV